MTFDEAMQAFAVAVAAVEQEHPELREIVRGARASSERIAQRFRVDRDAQRADHELATLLLDVAEAAERQAGVQRAMPDESVGGPPSFATLEAVRAQRRGALGIAGVGAGPPVRTFAGDVIGGAISASVAVRSGNRVIDWLLETFGGPTLDVDTPIGLVTIEPWRGNPTRAAAVMLGAFAAVAAAVLLLLNACSCPPCPTCSRGGA